MKHSRCLIACLLLIHFFYLNSTHASDQKISDQDIFKRHDILKKIATKICRNSNNIIKIRKKLREEHGPSAKSLWQEYDQNMIGGENFSEYQTLKSHIRSNLTKYSGLHSINTGKLKQLLGKKSSTFYSLNEINDIGTVINEAIEKGVYGPYSGGHSGKDYTFGISFNKNFGEKCLRGDDNKATNALNTCSPATSVLIIFKASDFFKEIISSNSWDSWEKKTSLTGEILSIY